MALGESGAGPTICRPRGQPPPQRQSSIPVPNTLLSTVNATRQRLPMCGECEKSLPNQIVFDKIESIIRKMQDEHSGLPVKTAKSFMTKIPSVFTGIDLVQWMMRKLKLEDQQEAIHLANLIASHGYIFPIEDHTLCIKNDCTFYRFQTPCLWPSNNIEPENTDYAVYLCKRTMQGKTRLELADYEAENLARLQKMFSRKWEFIFMQAESQAKVDKKRDKLERKVLDSQERAFWDVYRPVPGCVNTTELDIKKACRLSKSAKRCAECQKVSNPQPAVAVVASAAATNTAEPASPAQVASTAQQAPTRCEKQGQKWGECAQTSGAHLHPESCGPSNSSSPSPDAAGPMKAANELEVQSAERDLSASQSSSSLNQSSHEPASVARESPEPIAAAEKPDKTTETTGTTETTETIETTEETETTEKTETTETTGIEPADASERAAAEVDRLSAKKEAEQPAGGRPKTGPTPGSSDNKPQSQQPAHSHHHHHHPHHHHHHHHHHHPHTHSHAHHPHHHHHHHKQCPHYHKQQQPSQQQHPSTAPTKGEPTTPAQTESEPTAKVASGHLGRCSLKAKPRPSGSIDQLNPTSGGPASRRKSECNRMLSMSEVDQDTRAAQGKQQQQQQQQQQQLASSLKSGATEGAERPASACCSLSSMAPTSAATKQPSASTSDEPSLGRTSASAAHLQRKSSLNIARPPSADQASLLLAQPDRAPSCARKGSVSSSHQRAQLKGAQSICAPSVGSTGGSQELEPGPRPTALVSSGRSAGAGAGDMSELERELQALRIRLDRGGVKMSKVTQSYLSYFNQWAEYDPFIAQPIPSNPWQSDSSELWDSERQTKDVHLRRVRRWAFSLKELLNDPAGREQFHRFLEKEFSAENLKFWDAVQELKRVPARDVARRIEAIWTEYLAPDANCPINIDSKSYETSKKNMAKNKNNRYIFDEAAGHVYQLMKNDSYPRYLRSDMYKDYKEASERRRPNQVAFDVFKPQITTLKHKFNF